MPAPAGDPDLSVQIPRWLQEDAGLKSPCGRGEHSSSAAKAAVKTVALCRSSRPGRDKFRSDPLMTAVVGGALLRTR